MQFGNGLKDEKRDELFIKDAESNQSINMSRSRRFSNQKKRRKIIHNKDNLIISKAEQEKNTYLSRKIEQKEMDL
jgi:hypothetical protein